MSIRSIRKQPFCWQEKEVFRTLRKCFKGQELVKMRCLYDTITEIDSDFNGREIKYYTKTIHRYSGLSKDWIPKGLKKLEELGIIKIVEERENGKYKGKKLFFTGKIPQKTVTGKPVNGEPVDDQTEPSEHSIYLEHNNNLEHNNIYTPSSSNEEDPPPLGEEKSSKKNKSSNKNKYGEFQNVLLTDEEYQKLINRFGADRTDELIETLSAYIASRGKKYKSHYATLLNWGRRNGFNEGRRRVDEEDKFKQYEEWEKAHAIYCDTDEDT